MTLKSVQWHRNTDKGSHTPLEGPRKQADEEARFRKLNPKFDSHSPGLEIKIRRIEESENDHGHKRSSNN